jgi:hypothetical protein
LLGGRHRQALPVDRRSAGSESTLSM